jgi:hypothetical protein
LRAVSLLDEELFSLISSGIGLNRTKLAAIDTQLESNIPVYTAGKEPVAFIGVINGKEPIEASSEHPVLSFATNGDGSAGRNFVMHVRPFYINTDRKAVAVKDNTILLPYLYAQLADMKEKYGFNHSRKANRNGLAAVVLNIPVHGDGTFDVAEQSAVAEQFSVLSDMRHELKQKYYEMERLTITTEIDEEYSFRLVKIRDVFAIVRGSGKYTKTYAQGHYGSYPLYSGNTSQEFALIDSYDFDVPCLSWAIDGLAGYMMVHRRAFSATNHRGVLLPKLSGLDIDYAKFALEPIFRRIKKGRMGDNGENEYTSLPPFMIEDIEFEIPVDDEGNYNIAAQREIASKYLTVAQYKQEALDKLSILITQKVEL